MDNTIIAQHMNAVISHKQAEQATATIDHTTTVRQLRQALYEISNQRMTIAQLRKKLYDIVEQDAPVKVDVTLAYKLEI